MRCVGLVALCVVGCFSKPPAPQLGGGTDDDDGGLGSDGGSSAPNYMFVTRSTAIGDQLGDVMFADQMCQDAATNAPVPLPGVYRAWVSIEGMDAKDRLVIPGTPRTPARGWIRPDGRPFADTVNDITGGRIWYPPRIDETGEDAFATGEVVYTGTRADGTANGFDCATEASVTAGLSDAAGRKWTDVGTPRACGGAFHLYCFGVDRSAAVTVPKPPPGALRVFLSPPVTVSANSLTAWQQFCKSEAIANGMSGTFIPFVARTNSTARNLIASAQGGWYRVDDVEVAADHMFETFLAPINVQADGIYVTGASATPYVYSGAANFDTSATLSESCQNWTAPMNATAHPSGDMERSGPSSFMSNFTTCLLSNRLYCFQTQ